MNKNNKRNNVSGWVLLDKPTGLTSMRCVNIIKEYLNVKKAGHAGTLDPMATGMLPIALGEATKTIPYIVAANKVYEFIVQWGIETDSCDSDGNIISRSDKIVSQGDVEAILSEFVGEIEQVPPCFSAVKVAGVRAYTLARQGKPPQLEPRPVYVHSLRIRNHDVERNQTTFVMECGKGVYVRSIAQDMGKIFNCGGHVIQLRRCSVGIFNEDDMFLLDKIKNLVHTETVVSAYEIIIKPIEDALIEIPLLNLSQETLSKLLLGKEVLVNNEQLINIESGSIVRARKNASTILLMKYEKAHLKIMRSIENTNQKIFNNLYETAIVS